MDNNKRIEELVDFLNRCNHAYYVACSPLISDYEFDMMLKELQSLEAESGYVLPYSPTQRVGSDLQDGFNEVERTRMMGSIENSYDYDELRKWLDSYDHVGNSFLLEPKYDGLSLSIIYKNGVLVQGTTRGTGLKGTDVTENIKMIKSIPLKLQVIEGVCVAGDWHYNGLYVPEDIEIRGEVLLPKSEFARINNERIEQGLEPFANERNAAAGSLKQLDPAVTASRNLIFMPYAVYADSDEEFRNKYLNEHHKGLDVAEIFGFNSPHYWRCCDANTVISFVREFKERFLKNQDYKMDGCVIKLDSVKMQDEVGYTQKVPRWAKAFKFEQESVSTKLHHVEWQVSREGKLSPVGILKPVDVDGSTISNVYLNNIDFIKDLDIKTGGYIFIEKGGGVIPKTTGVDYERNIREGVFLKDIDEPSVCPCCGQPVVRMLDEGANLYCTNDQCPDRKIAKLNYFVSKDCMNIKHIGDAVVRQMFESTIDGKWQGLYLATLDDIVACGVGEKNAVKIYGEIQKSRQLPGDRILTALGIPMCGKVTAKKILDYYGNIKTFESDVISNGKLAEINGIGSVAADKIATYVLENGDEFKFIYEHINYVGEKSTAVSSGLLSGKTILATGTLNNFTRDGIKESVVSNGGKYASGVSRKIDFIIVGSNPGQSKIDKANELGVPMIGEDEYIAMIRG